MSKWEHPSLLLLLGSVLGGTVTAIYLTDFFGIDLPAGFLPESIDSGWGSLVGALITGLVAIGLFWVQRRVDQNDRVEETKKRNLINISFAIRCLEEIEEFYSNEKVIKDLGGFIESKNHKYVADNSNEVMSIIITFEVYTAYFPKKIRKASSYLYLVSDDSFQYAQMRDICHYYAIALDEIADSLDECISRVGEDKAKLISDYNQARSELVCTRIQSAFFKLNRVVGCVARLRDFS